MENNNFVIFYNPKHVYQSQIKPFLDIELFVERILKGSDNKIVAVQFLRMFTNLSLGECIKWVNEISKKVNPNEK